MIAQPLALSLDLVDGPLSGMAWAVWLVFLRVGAMMALLPAFGERSVPVRVKLVLTLAFTAIVGPVVAPLPAPGPGLPALLAEAANGLILGIGLRLFIHALHTAGTMAAQATSLSQVFGGAGADPQPAMSHILVISGLALAVTLGLHLRVAEVLVLSYQVLPAGRFPMPEDVAAWGVARVGRMFALAFMIAAPFLIGSLVYNLALGAINRAMPLLMVAFIGAPALTFGGLLFLALVAPPALALWMSLLDAHLADPFAVPR